MDNQILESAKEWANNPYFDEADREEMELGKFIEHEIGGLDKIFDPKVREIIQKKL